LPALRALIVSGKPKAYRTALRQSRARAIAPGTDCHDNRHLKNISRYLLRTLANNVLNCDKPESVKSRSIQEKVLRALERDAAKSVDVGTRIVRVATKASSLPPEQLTSGGIMESRAKILGHPIHQMLIPFPLGLLGTAVIFDIIYLIWGNPTMGSDPRRAA
jgi:hypothetical protein